MTKIVSSTRTPAAVEVEGLVRSFGSTRAVDGLSLVVPRGHVYGLLGPNGAGKTTLVRILATLLRPDAGTARVAGHDVVRQGSAVRAKIALTGQFASVDADLTGRENLVVLARLLGFRHRQAKTRADELLAAFALEGAATRLVRTYSGGMRRRLDLAASVIVRPELLFLDEPTTGLDPQSRAQVWDMVREMAWEGTTVLLTTQYLEEADRLASRMAVIDHGSLVAEGTSEELKRLFGHRILRISFWGQEDAIEAQRVLSGVLDSPSELDRDAPVLSVRVPTGRSAREDAEQVAAVLAALGRADLAVSEIGIQQPSLDEVFISLTESPAPPHDLAGVHSA